MPIGTIQSGRTEQFRENHSVNVGIAAVRTAIFTFTVPPKARCRILEFGNYLGTVAAWGTAYWNFIVNGVALDFYGGTPNIFDQVGYAAQRQTSTLREFSGGSLIVLAGSNPTAAILAMGISLSYEFIYQE